MPADPSVSPRVAYFSMEIALDPAIPTYSGGLGVLAGDTLRSAADLGAPIAAVTLAHRKGYFKQQFDEGGRQTEAPEEWRPGDVLERLEAETAVNLEGRQVKLRAWRYVLTGFTGHQVPVFLLDASGEENDPTDRALTDQLYGGDSRHRLRQEAILGIGGVRMLRALGFGEIETFHMNEGHSALLALELLQERTGEAGLSAATEEDLQAVRRRCVFTTHTPVPAGHDRFGQDLAAEVLGEERVSALRALGGFPDGELNMTYLALRASHYVNGVAMRHGEVSAGMFPHYPVSAITNGVHAASWIAPPIQDLFDRYIPQWRRDNLYLRYALGIPLNEVMQAHEIAKHALLDRIAERTGTRLDPRALTIGFARRATAYKRAALVFSDVGRLLAIASRIGPLQFVFGGKAHPRDEDGKELIRHIFEISQALRGKIPVVYVEDYGIEWARYLVSGADLWLNTPQRPQEASGTSGMKAALNGVPSLSILDGWWVEGCIEDVTGWAIEDGEEGHGGSSAEAASLYDKLERVIAPAYYGRPSAYAAVRRFAAAVNGSYFNTQRMVSQYLDNAYFPGGRAGTRASQH